MGNMWLSIMWLRIWDLNVHLARLFYHLPDMRKQITMLRNLKWWGPASDLQELKAASYWQPARQGISHSDNHKKLIPDNKHVSADADPTEGELLGDNPVLADALVIGLETLKHKTQRCHSKSLLGKLWVTKCLWLQVLSFW